MRADLPFGQLPEPEDAYAQSEGAITMPNARELKNMLFDALNDHDLDRVLQCYSPDAVMVTPAGIAEGHEQIAWYYDHLFKGFPDMRMTAWHKLTCADPAVTEWTLTGTHTGPFLLPDGEVVEPTSRSVAMRGAGACAVENGKILTHRDYYDQLELYSQLGFTLTPEPAT